MRLTSLELENFRNYRQARLDLGSSLTVLEGHNAAGKSNLLESLVLLGEAASPRASRDEFLIREDAGYAHLRCQFERGGR